MAVRNSNTDPHIMVSQERGKNGRPRILISEDSVSQLLTLGLPVTCIARLLGVSKFTIHRRMGEWGLSVKATYSNITDAELDALVATIHTSNPNAGYRMMMGLLRAQGHRVQWDRVRSSMHRVDTASIVYRMSQLGCVVRRTYSVPSPKSLMHIDTNHKLIRYNIVIFGGIDGFSRKIMYLGVSNNNLVSTTLSFFREAVEKFGFPLRVRGDHGGENVDVACLMFSVRGTGRSSFIAESSDCGGMCSLRLPPTSTMFCTSWKRMGILICPAVSTSSAVTMPSSHVSKPISIYLEMDGTTILFHQRATSLLINCGNWGSSTIQKSVMRIYRFHK
ncbi:uncharacterized protein LOC125262256 isoform X2 [Megalobrama amblycephala]|uniref:uncharacterized protein LOC125262256 isoform X2 n=1 Tax=Megalobrama amblycephala TaxID=75352 RepID=UPI00201406B5|nr:uncharacterized protein LOC125262256 isoform X2 [Megalobrama amblycephala]